ncbi:MAG: hypothetical protein ABWX94_00610 [Candidatus Saccharimonadales bacterium]
MNQLHEVGVSRRSFLRAAVATATAAALSRNSSFSSNPEYNLRSRQLRDLASVQTYDAPKSYDAPAFHMNAKVDTSNFPQRDKLVVASNQRLYRPMTSKGHAYAITHPGFIEGQIDSFRKDLVAGKPVNPRDEDLLAKIANIAQGKYGDFEAHQNNMLRVFKTLGETTTPTVCLYDSINDPAAIRPEFRSPNNSFSLATLLADGTLAETVSMQDENDTLGYVNEAQDPNLLFDAWKDAGVTEVHVGGEFSMQPDTGDTACLGKTTEMFLDAGFTVRGIQGAIYPPEAPAFPRDKQLAAVLYNNPVPIGAVMSDRY